MSYDDTTRVAELPYTPDSAELFERFVDLPWAVFLDSGGVGRYDILAAEPYATLVTRGNKTVISPEGGEAVSRAEDPFALLREWLGATAQSTMDIPFAGGAIGWFGYDLARRLEQLPALAADPAGLPEMAVGLYDWAVVVDHARRRSYLVSHGRVSATAQRWESLLRRLTAPVSVVQRDPFHLTSPLCGTLDDAAYRLAFEQVKRYIRDGDCYQVNLARGFFADATGDPWRAYRAMRHLNPAPFSAYMNTPEGRVLSASPERFLKVTGGEVETRPIKGTRPRADDPAQDRALAEALRQSPKDRAENLMIVDLLRNDLGRCCIPGSVQVPELFKIESFATVHHLVSTVTGTLRPECDALALLRACFPGGSITGAPKLRAMEIIEELEPIRRGLYCGAIGYIGFDGAMDTNIAIRTLVYRNGTIRFWAGGGLVHDSELAAELQETEDKASAMRRLLSVPR